ncbi:HAD superfamily hydrolase (TIGR01509 family) [Nocardioides zeae]|uniref:HAD superfamily hydrolase (TIGR01509 family) n=1 Tax=Nocardioides zeae TaxID=1457234 RepID=A0ACC6IHQ7_9ACTN|nr:HAD family phosphatase [Nocardioides zeae]MDR6210290.1 HAD superfamily hydrolase (TIGR01509 family) [Nocardioides zeae]
MSTEPGPGERPAAVLWDMDGTLVDTEPYWIETEFAMAERYGATWTTEDALQLVGNDLLVSGEYIRTRMGLELSAADVVEELLDGVVARITEAIPWRPGARELLADLRRAGIPCALVTMSYRRFAEPVVAALEEGSFEAVVTGDEVEHGKPHPAPYLRAAWLLGVEPGDCVAIEDSSTGVASAVAAGCRTLAVPHHVPVPPGPGHVQAASLEGLDATALWDLVRP